MYYVMQSSECLQIVGNKSMWTVGKMNGSTFFSVTKFICIFILIIVVFLSGGNVVIETILRSYKEDLAVQQ